jgi:hypothetical protein
MKIQVDVGELKGEELESVVDEDIKRFDKFFQEELKNEPMRKDEKAILKTYLWWKANRDSHAG